MSGKLEYRRAMEKKVEQLRGDAERWRAAFIVTDEESHNFERENAEMREFIGDLLDAVTMDWQWGEPFYAVKHFRMFTKYGWLEAWMRDMYEANGKTLPPSR